MTQSKIISFFKPSSAKAHYPAPPAVSGHVHPAVSSSPPLDEDKFRVTYRRRNQRRTNHPEQDGWENGASENLSTVEDEDHSTGITESPCLKSKELDRVPNKKRTYAQYHLELGQSDFFLCTCSVCGLRYSRGDEEDEKLHKSFHKDYFYGVQFKGWRSERVVVALPDKERILLVSDGDPSGHRDKVTHAPVCVSLSYKPDLDVILTPTSATLQFLQVLEVVRIVERDLDLNNGWLLHDLCKVYMFISKSRVAGVLVAEPIKSAYRVRPSSETAESPQISRETDVKDTKTPTSSSILRFGSINFEREVDNKASSCVKKGNATVETNAGTIICESQAIPACCGIRAIWVVPSRRRQHVATHLLDALRKSFCMGYVLEPIECAFTQTTSVGRLLACSYTGTKAFLIYKAGN
ncbi:CHROMOSOME TRANSMISSION FIDELITY 7 protein [Nymphaea thermarum]|nr:CHROMOSOME TRANSMISSION FIDELITY 7 protein [Nymphaea thermarum]